MKDFIINTVTIDAGPACEVWLPTGDDSYVKRGYTFDELSVGVRLPVGAIVAGIAPAMQPGQWKSPDGKVLDVEIKVAPSGPS